MRVRTRLVTVKRIKPNILSERFDESRSFYNEVIGLDGGYGLDWILFFGTDQEEVQLSVMKLDIKRMSTPTCRSKSMTSTTCTSVLSPPRQKSCTQSRTRSGDCVGSSFVIQTAR